jgi:uncharacterized membrane protein
MMEYPVVKAIHVLSMCVWFGVDLGVHASLRLGTNPALVPITRREFLRMRRVLDFGPQVAMIATVPIGLSLLRLGEFRFSGVDLWVIAVPLCVVALAWIALLVVAPTHSGFSPMPVRGAMRTVDTVLRVVVIVAFVALAVSNWQRSADDGLGWINWKMLIFAAVVACGLWIRLLLTAPMSDAVLGPGDPSLVADATWDTIRQCYARCRLPVALSWIGIVAAVIIGTGKPV